MALVKVGNGVNKEKAKVEVNRNTKKLSQIDAIDVNTNELAARYRNSIGTPNIEYELKGKPVIIFAKLDSVKKDSDGQLYLLMSSGDLSLVCYLDTNCASGNLYRLVAETETEIVPGYKDKSVKVKGIFRGNTSDYKSFPIIQIDNSIFWYDGKWACDSNVE